MRTAWHFVHPTTFVQIPLPVNPKEDTGSLAMERDIKYQNTAGTNGKTLIFEAGEKMPKASFTGVIYTQNEYNIFIAEMTRPQYSTMVDDRGVIFVIVWEQFLLTRDWSRRYPWKHTYDLQGYVVSYTLP